MAKRQPQTRRTSLGLAFMVIASGFALGASAASPSLRIRSGLVLKADMMVGANGIPAIDLRLRRGVQGHGTSPVYRTVHLVARDADGQVIAVQDKRINKLQTYVRLVPLPQMAAASWFDVLVQTRAHQPKS